MKTKKLVYVSDLTHTGQTIALNAMPYAIACLISYAKKYLNQSNNFDFRIFKYPNSLIKAIVEEAPDIACFSNYMWNIDIASSIAKRLKEKNPHIITIFGGPNYPTNPEEQKMFFDEYPMVDFYVYKEGELAFAEILSELCENSFDIPKTKESLPKSAHFVIENKLVAGPPLDRIKNLDEIHSPYLSGLLDEFFDENLVPVLQINRGCPFACTFCVEGLDYYTKVNKKTPAFVREELLYMASHKHPTIHDLHWVDSNAGMYKDDEEIAEFIAEVQERYSWPEHIHVSTGKNQKERVLKVARTIKGALRLSGAVQSLDPTVLQNIKRSNIKEKELMALAQEGKEIGSNVYSEVILALPGESKESHLKTFETLINAKFQIVRSYSLMMLSGVEMSEKSTRDKFKIKTGFRAMPRCLGIYAWKNENPIISIEIEEVCFETKDMCFLDYVECREFHLSNEIFFNDSVCIELIEFLNLAGIPVFDFINGLHMERNSFPQKLKKLYSEFVRETREELWTSKKELMGRVKSEKVAQEYLSGERGSNLLFKYKALALTSAVQEIVETAYAQARKILHSRKSEFMQKYDLYLNELHKYSFFRKTKIFDTGQSYHQDFFYDIFELEKTQFRSLPDEFFDKQQQQFTFAHTNQQKKFIDDNLKRYGNNIVGHSRIISKFPVFKMYRNITKSPA